jgi:hypothetical protein
MKLINIVLVLGALLCLVQPLQLLSNNHLQNWDSVLIQPDQQSIGTKSILPNVTQKI